MLFPRIAVSILRELAAAEACKKPVTLKDALERWGSGSTWEDLVDGGYVYRLPGAVFITTHGRQWLAKHAPR